MSFEEYLVSKKIDKESFAQAEPTIFAKWQSTFDLLHVESFTNQHKFTINKIRRRFLAK